MRRERDRETEVSNQSHIRIAFYDPLSPFLLIEAKGSKFSLL